jgi:cell division protein FtsW
MRQTVTPGRRGGAERAPVQPGRPGRPSRQPRLRDVAAAGLAVLDRPLTSYYLLLGIGTLLLALGLVMVLSTSSVDSLMQGTPPYASFQHQLLGVAAGIPCMWLASRCRPALLRAAVYPLLFLAVLGLLLVPVAGSTYQGATREIFLGPFAVQPSELAKLGFALWGADLLARRERLGQVEEWRRLLIPLLPGAGALSLLVMLGHDLGTTFLLLVIFLALLWVAGAPGRLYAGILGMIGLVLAILILVEGYRLQRINLFLHPSGNPMGLDQQPIQGKWAVGSGQWFGLGLGAGRQKWGYVPNDTTDFIFAIIGEELGLVGTLCVSLLYGGLAYAGLRIARRVSDTFIRLAATAITAWIVVEALVNICAVIGLLPITGVPLPLISYGLSSTLVTMVALGILMSFAKLEPGASQALAAAGPGLARRVLSWLGLARRPD